ncbi:MAG TPA: efflux RND transporter periplasmic adaptor subunit [Xanthobacteraceae bacterium]|jgi:RND family efflux transporter MFP subunit
MKRRKLVMVAATVALGAVVAAKWTDWAPWDLWTPKGAVAQAEKQSAASRAVPVEVVTAVKKKVPVRVDLLGTVTPIASVAVKTRIDTTIRQVHFSDGAMVRQGDLLFTLDGSTIEAQIRQAEGQLARDQASLEGAERDVRRYADLVTRSATPVINLDNAKTQAGVYAGAIKADQGMLDNLKVQLAWCRIYAPISGRISMAAVKEGNFVRQADLQPIATINQMAPVYVTFAVPQGSLPALRQALANETATIEAAIPGETRKASGQVTMIENTVDMTTGTVPVRATMPNTDELLWPGTLVTVQLSFREEEAVVLPPNAVQVGQNGSYVFVIKDGVAHVQPVKVARVVDEENVLESGLEGGETVVTEGQLRITDGSRVSMRATKAGS